MDYTITLQPRYREAVEKYLAIEGNTFEKVVMNELKPFITNLEKAHVSKLKDALDKATPEAVQTVLQALKIDEKFEPTDRAQEVEAVVEDVQVDP